MTTGYSHWFLDFNLQNARNVPSVASSGSLELVTESFPILRAFSYALNGEVFETVLAGYGAFILVPLGTARRSMAIDTPLENLNCASFRRDKVAIYGIPANKDDGIFRANASLYEIIAASSYDPAGMASLLNGTMPMKIAGDHTVLSLIERDWFDMESTIAAKLALSTRLQPRPDTSYQILGRICEFDGKKDDGTTQRYQGVEPVPKDKHERKKRLERYNAYLDKWIPEEVIEGAIQWYIDKAKKAKSKSK